MEGSELQKIVANFVSHRWRHGIQRGLDSSLRWLPVIKINEDIWYGLSKHGRWVEGAENKNVRLVELSTEG